MSDPRDLRHDWTRAAGQHGDVDSGGGAAQMFGDHADLGRPALDPWKEAYGRRPPPDRPTRRWSLRGLAWTLSVLIPLVAVNEASYAWDYFTRAPQAFSQDGYFVAFNFGFLYPLAEGAPQVGSLILFVATMVLFIAWQFLHGKNARVLGQVATPGPGWAIGGWFIPIANLILPAIQLILSSAASDPPPNRYGDVASRNSLVIWWAVAFDISLLELLIVAPNRATAETIDTINLLLGMLYIPAAVLAVVMIWQLTTRQETALDARGL